MKEKILSLTKKDFVIDTLRGSGPGGQKRNKTESAVRIKHPASGAEAYCCDERSQHSNKAKAFRHLVDSKIFRNWLQIEIARVTGVIDQVTKEVDTSLANPDNIRVEVHDDSGKWVELVQ